MSLAQAAAFLAPYAYHTGLFPAAVHRQCCGYEQNQQPTTGVKEFAPESVVSAATLTMELTLGMCSSKIIMATPKPTTPIPFNILANYLAGAQIALGSRSANSRAQRKRFTRLRRAAICDAFGLTNRE